MSIRLIRKPYEKVFAGAGRRLLTDPHLEVRVTRVMVKLPDGQLIEVPRDAVQVELEFFAPPEVNILREEILVRQMYERAQAQSHIRDDAPPQGTFQRRAA